MQLDNKFVVDWASLGLIEEEGFQEVASHLQGKPLAALHLSAAPVIQWRLKPKIKTIFCSLFHFTSSFLKNFLKYFNFFSKPSSFCSQKPIFFSFLVINQYFFSIFSTYTYGIHFNHTKFFFFLLNPTQKSILD